MGIREEIEPAMIPDSKFLIPDCSLKFGIWNQKFGC